MAIKRTGVELVAEGEAEFVAALKRADGSVVTFGRSVKKTSDDVNATGASFTKVAEKIDGMGRNTRIGLSAAAQAAELFGANISGVVGPAANAADAIGDIVGSIGSLGAAAGIIGGVITAAGFLASQWDAAGKAIAKTQDEIHAKFAELQKTFAPDGVTASTEFAAALGLTEEALKRITSASPEAAAAVRDLINAQEGYAQVQSKMDSIQNARKTLQAGAGLSGIDALLHVPSELQAYMTLLQQGAGTNQAFDASLKELQYSAMESSRGIREAAAAAAIEAEKAEIAAAATQKAADTNAYYANQTQLAADAALQFANDLAASAQAAQVNTWLDATNRRYNDMDKLLGQRYPVSVAVAKDKTDDFLKSLQRAPSVASSAAQAIQQVTSKLKGLIENEMNFTSVTDEDMAASAAGTYTDKWDEFLRRAKAVQSGTDPAQFGEDFKKQLEGLGMPLDEVIRKFQNFQLFVGGANFDLVNFNAFTTQIEDQLLGMAGKASLTEEAMKRVWANLSPTAKAALATTGIENAEDALKQFLDPAGQAKDEVSDLNKEINSTPTLVTTTFDVVKAPTFDPVLAQIAEDLSIIPSAADILVTIYYESRNKPPDSGGTLGDGSAVPPGYASGGAGVFGTDQLVRVHAGEGFWFSGTQWQYPIPGAFGRMVEPAAPSSVRYGDSSANINVTVNANRVASSVDVDHLANRVAESIRSQVMTRRRAGA